jgi:hypothetical protein
MTELWICGQLKGKWSPKGSKWEFQGVFSKRSKAVKACKNSNYFIYPVCLNEEYPLTSVLPTDFEYPFSDKTSTEFKTWCKCGRPLEGYETTVCKFCMNKNIH